MGKQDMDIKGKCVRRWLGILLLFVAVLGGCTKQEENHQGSMEGTPVSDWTEKGFAISAQNNEDCYWTEHYETWNGEWIQKELGEGEAFYQIGQPGLCGSKTWNLYAIYMPPVFSVSKWLLEVYDAEKKAYETHVITWESLGLSDEDKGGYLLGAEWISGDDWVFQWSRDEKGEEVYRLISDKRIFVDFENAPKVVEFQDVFLREGLSENEVNETSYIRQKDLNIDADGNVYKTDWQEGESGKICVFDRDGKKIMDESMPQELEFAGTFRMETGERIYFLQDKNAKKQVFYWVDAAGGKCKKMAECTDMTSIRKIYGQCGDNIYYETFEGAFRWNFKSGERTLILKFQDAGVANKYDKTLLVTKDGRLFYHFYDGAGSQGKQGKEWIVSLSIEEPADTAIRIVDFVRGTQKAGEPTKSGTQRILQGIAMLKEEDPNHRFVYESVTQKEQRERIWNELISGEGPDILYVSRKEMEELATKGAIQDLSEIMEKADLERLWPAVLELSSVDGKVYGFVPSVGVETILVSDQVWQGDFWTFEEMLGKMKSGELNPRLYYPASANYFAPYACVRMMFRYAMDQSWLVDQQEGQSHFSDDRFVTYLELVAKAKQDDGDNDTLLGAGNRMALQTFHYTNDRKKGSKEGFLHYFGEREEKEGGHYVGFPTENGRGNYMACEGVCVVNAKAKDLKAVAFFLHCMLDEKIQNLNGDLKPYSISILKLREEQISYDEDGDPCFDGEKIHVFEDGTNSFDKAKEFLESCTAAPMIYEDIDKIMMEEVEAFLAGDKSARETAEIIDNRVRIYLNE